MAPDADKPFERQTRDAASAADTPRARKAYVAPELIEYGSVAKLTQAGGQTVQDFLFWRRMRTTCL